MFVTTDFIMLFIFISLVIPGILFLMITSTNQLPSRYIIGVTYRNTKFQLDTGFKAQEIGTTS